MYYIKIHKKGMLHVTAICDKDILGKKFDDGNRQLIVEERFYKGKIADDKDAITAMRGADILNITGNKIVELAIKENIIKKEDVMTVKGMAHAEIF